MGFLLFAIAYILFLPLTIINWLMVDKKDYFRQSAINLDKYANMEFKTLFNNILIVESGYKFGQENETISRVLGKNLQQYTLTKIGIIIVWVLDKIDKNHVIKAIK